MQENFFEEFEKSNYETWKIAAEKSLKGADFDKSLLTPLFFPPLFLTKIPLDTRQN